MSETYSVYMRDEKCIKILVKKPVANQILYYQKGVWSVIKILSSFITTL